MSMLAHPGAVIDKFLSPAARVYLLNIFGPLAFLPFFSLSLIMTLPFFCQHILSNRFAEIMINFHYTAEIIPFLFTALILGIHKLKKNQTLAISIIAATSCIGYCFIGPISTGTFSLNNCFRPQIHKQYQNMINLVSKNASIATTLNLTSHLTSRKSLYSFYNIYYGKYPLSLRDYPLPDDMDYSLIDFSNYIFFDSYSPEQYTNLTKMLRKYNLAASKVCDSLVLFKQNINEPFELYNISLHPPSPLKLLNLKENPNITWLGYDTNPYLDGVFIKLYFKCLKAQVSDKYVVFQFILPKNPYIIKSIRVPLCYDLYPAHIWQPGEYISCNFYLKYPEFSSQKDKKLMALRAIIMSCDNKNKSLWDTFISLKK
jgi:hypothetical protein